MTSRSQLDTSLQYYPGGAESKQPIFINRIHSRSSIIRVGIDLIDLIAKYVGRPVFRCGLITTGHSISH